MSPPTQSERRHDVDWLRVLAIALLLLFHAALAFEPWGGFIQNDATIEVLIPPISLLATWRIPLLFFVSGMGLCWAGRRRSFGQLVVERTRRILVPCLVAVFGLIPLHALIRQRYAGEPLAYSPSLFHVWFLAYIYAYVVMWGYGLHWLGTHDNAFVRRLRRLVGNSLGLHLFALPFVLEAELCASEHYGYYLDQHGVWLGAFAFATGALFAAMGHAYWRAVDRTRWPNLLLAFALFGLRWWLWDLATRPALGALEMFTWVLAIFGFAQRHLNRDSRALRYLSQAAYPVYLVHMLCQYAASALVMPLGLSAWSKLALVVAGTFGGSLLLYELLIRRVPLLRPLFGLRWRAA